MDLKAFFCFRYVLYCLKCCFSYSAFWRVSLYVPFFYAFFVNLLVNFYLSVNFRLFGSLSAVVIKNLRPARARVCAYSHKILFLFNFFSISFLQFSKFKKIKKEADFFLLLFFDVDSCEKQNFNFNIF